MKFSNSVPPSKSSTKRSINAAQLQKLASMESNPGEKVCFVDSLQRGFDKWYRFCNFILRSFALSKWHCILNCFDPMTCYWITCYVDSSTRLLVASTPWLVALSLWPLFVTTCLFLKQTCVFLKTCHSLQYCNVDLSFWSMFPTTPIQAVQTTKDQNGGAESFQKFYKHKCLDSGSSRSHKEWNRFRLLWEDSWPPT